MASLWAIWVPWDVYDHKTPLGAHFQLYVRIGGIFKEAKRDFIDILVAKQGLKKHPKMAFLVKTPVFAFKKALFFVKTENHPMYTSLQKKKWPFLKPQIRGDKKKPLKYFFAGPQKFWWGW